MIFTSRASSAGKQQKLRDALAEHFGDLGHVHFATGLDKVTLLQTLEVDMMIDTSAVLAAAAMRAGIQPILFVREGRASRRMRWRCGQHLILYAAGWLQLLQEAGCALGGLTSTDRLLRQSSEEAPLNGREMALLPRPSQS